MRGKSHVREKKYARIIAHAYNKFRLHTPSLRRRRPCVVVPVTYSRKLSNKTKKQWHWNAYRDKFIIQFKTNTRESLADNLLIIISFCAKPCVRWPNKTKIFVCSALIAQRKYSARYIRPQATLWQKKHTISRFYDSSRALLRLVRARIFVACTRPKYYRCAHFKIILFYYIK